MADPMVYEFLNLRCKSRDPNALSVTGRELGVFGTLRFLTGESGQFFPQNAKIYVEGKKTDIVNNPFSIHIISAQLADLLLDHVASQIELVPAPLFAQSGEKIDGYFVLNCLNMVDCIDWKNSVYSGSEELDTLFVFDVAIDSDKVPDDVSIFRVPQAPENGVFLRMSLYDGLRKPGSDVELVGVKSSCNAELLDARSKANQAALNEEQECIQLIKQARELLKQNRRQEVMEGLVLARKAAAMSSIRLDVRVVAMVQLEVALRRCREYLEALQVCESCLADPDMIQAKGKFERSAALCEWRLGKIDQAIARLKNSLSEEENEHIRSLLLEIESAKSAE
jgi:hypothetical protein